MDMVKRKLMLVTIGTKRLKAMALSELYPTRVLLENTLTYTS